MWSAVDCLSRPIDVPNGIIRPPITLSPSPHSSQLLLSLPSGCECRLPLAYPAPIAASSSSASPHNVNRRRHCLVRVKQSASRSTSSVVSSSSSRSRLLPIPLTMHSTLPQADIGMTHVPLGVSLPPPAAASSPLPASGSSSSPLDRARCRLSRLQLFALTTLFVPISQLYSAPLSRRHHARRVIGEPVHQVQW